MSKDTKVVTGKVRLSYPNLFEPKSIEEGSPAKYSCALIIDKDDDATISKIEKAIEAAYQLKKGSFGKTSLKRLKAPLRDGDEDRPEDPAYRNCYFLNATSKTRPKVAELVNGKISEVADDAEQTKAEKLYSGCYVSASLNFYSFAVKAQKGIAAGLNAVLKVADGEPLGFHIDLEDEFSDYADFEVTEDDNSDVDDILG